MSYNPSNYTRCEKCKHIDRENEKCKITNDNWLVSDRAGTCHQFEGVDSMEREVVETKNKKGFKKGDWIKITNKEIAAFLNINLKNEFKVLKVEAFNVKVYVNSKMGFVWINNKCVERAKSENEKLEENPHEKLEKEFEEQMERVGDLASKCSVSGEELFNNPIKPSHYQAGEFDVIAFCFKHNLDFASGNVVKYIVRTGKKDKNKELEDLLKAREYLERKIEWVKANV